MVNKTRIKRVGVEANRMDKDIYNLESKQIALKQKLYIARQQQIKALETKIESLNFSLQKALILLTNTHLQASTKLTITNLKEEIKNIKRKLKEDRQNFKQTNQLEKVYLNTKKALLKEKKAKQIIANKASMSSSKKNKALQNSSPELSHDLNKPVTKKTKNTGKKWIPKISKIKIYT